ncbi:DUF333 domain-containing protein [Sphingomonas cavernae]|uniref:DUF333 domain-containing protein n=2 Tax=Sphingomonas cavernae TaxID=2320861 RepID=A0A418WNN0_9SPHN|nr:DUF333 domain-containing protein [Sphingomonas cavernae]
MLFAMASLLAGCSSAPPEPKPVGMPNPAAVNCGKQGGRSEIRTAADGSQYGICHLPDGRQCEEWALLREGKCVARTD